MSSELWLLAVIPLLAWLLARRRASRALKEAEVVFIQEPPVVTAEELGKVVGELSQELAPPTRVTSPTLGTESSHVWNSPSGKRVYIN